MRDSLARLPSFALLVRTALVWASSNVWVALVRADTTKKLPASGALSAVERKKTIRGCTGKAVCSQLSGVWAFRRRSACPMSLDRWAYLLAVLLKKGKVSTRGFGVLSGSRVPRATYFNSIRRLKRRCRYCDSRPRSCLLSA